jgi:L-asparaginase II
MERKNPFTLLDPLSLPPSGNRALEVCVIRGSSVESRHRVHAMVSDRRGEVLHSWGNPELSFFPRSAVKLLQALPWMVAPQKNNKLELTEEEMAIACGSHRGEEIHVGVVKSWLERIGLEESELECGAHPPYHHPAADQLIREGKTACQLHNNCSGKHVGILTGCLAMGWETQGYSHYDHPAQERIREVMGSFFDFDLRLTPWGIDGCGIPTYAVSLAALAQAMARIADPAGLDSQIQTAVSRLNNSIERRPDLIGGTDSFCSQVVSETQGRVFAKVGAEGVYGGWIPGSGLGIALKCEDGSSRAAEAAMVAILRELGHPVSFFSPLLKRWTGEVVGQVFCG